MNEFFESMLSWSDEQLDWLMEQVPGEILWPYHLRFGVKGAWAGLIPGNYHPYIYVRFDATIPSRPMESKYARDRMFWGEWYAASRAVLFKLPQPSEQSHFLKEIIAASRRSQFVSWGKDWRDCQFSDELCVPASALLDYPKCLIMLIRLSGSGKLTMSSRRPPRPAGSLFRHLTISWWDTHCGT